jgi:hypothetical protein
MVRALEKASDGLSSGGSRLIVPPHRFKKLVAVLRLVRQGTGLPGFLPLRRVLPQAFRQIGDELRQQVVQFPDLGEVL